MTTIKESLDLVPLCPHCEAPLNTVDARPIDVGRGGGAQIRFGKRYIYACPSCGKALSISHRKGFWAG